MKRLINKGDCLSFDTAFMKRNFPKATQIFNRLASEHKNVVIFDPQPYLATPKINDIILYRDDDHLNAQGSDFLSRYFIEFMK